MTDVARRKLRFMCDLSKSIRRRLVSAGGKRYEVIPVGSIRRMGKKGKQNKKEAIHVPGDLDFLVVVPDRKIDEPGLLAGMRLRKSKKRSGKNIALAKAPAGSRISRTRHTQAIVTVGDTKLRVPVDIFLVGKSERPYALYHYTGPREYNIRTRSYAKRNGMKLNQYGLFDATTNEPVRGSRVRTEREVAELLGVTYYPPSKRK